MSWKLHTKTTKSNAISMSVYKPKSNPNGQFVIRFGQDLVDRLAPSYDVLFGQDSNFSQLQLKPNGSFNISNNRNRVILVISGITDKTCEPVKAYSADWRQLVDGVIQLQIPDPIMEHLNVEEKSL